MPAPTIPPPITTTSYAGALTTRRWRLPRAASRSSAPGRRDQARGREIAVDERPQQLGEPLDGGLVGDRDRRRGGELRRRRVLELADRVVGRIAQREPERARRF